MFGFRYRQGGPSSRGGFETFALMVEAFHILGVLQQCSMSFGQPGISGMAAVSPS